MRPTKLKSTQQRQESARTLGQTCKIVKSGYATQSAMMDFFQICLIFEHLMQNDNQNMPLLQDESKREWKKVREMVKGASRNNKMWNLESVKLFLCTHLTGFGYWHGLPTMQCHFLHSNVCIRILHGPRVSNIIYGILQPQHSCRNVFVMFKYLE